MKRTPKLRSFSLFQKVVACILSAAVPLATLPPMALALPHGGTVAKGQATLGYSTGRLGIRQSTSSATFDWGSYNVKAGQSVVYSVPGSSSVSLNYIGGTTPSTISGKVTSNGILEFMNANGLVFGSGSVVSAAGVMAFGSSTPWGTPTGSVTNAGTITATNKGTVALVGTSVTNSGTVSAPGGTAILAAGSTVTPIAQAEGASLSVATTGGGLVDDSGIVSAETVSGQTGHIILQSGMNTGAVVLESSAVIDASAPNGGNGGHVTLNGSGIILDNAIPVNVSSSKGTPGTVTIDPTYLVRGSTFDACDATGLEYLDANQSSYLTDTVNLMSSMNLNGYSWIPLGNNSLTPFTGTFNGNGYTVSAYMITALSNYSGTGFIGYLGSTGTVEHLGVGGIVNGGNNYNVGGVVGDNAGGTVEYSYNTGSVSGGLGSSSVGGVVGDNAGGTVEYSYNTGSVFGPGSSVGGVVGANNPSSTVAYSYNTGMVTGNGSYVGGVVGYNHSTVEYSYNTGFVGGKCIVGGVVGYNNGTVEYSYNTGSVSGGVDNAGNGGGNVGGVVGCNYNGTVEYSYNTGSVSGGVGNAGIVNDVNDVEAAGNGGGNVGGVVGCNTGSVATVKYSYNTGSVSGGHGGGGGTTIGVFGGNGGGNVGGVVGDNASMVEYSYNTGSISGGNGGNSAPLGWGGNSGGNVGGVVGYNAGSVATVKYSYNTGSISGGNAGNIHVGYNGGYAVGNVGGVVGDNSGTVGDSYNTGSVSGGCGGNGGGGNVGGVVGDNSGTVGYSYYNNTVYTGSAIGGGTSTGSTVMGVFPISTTYFGTPGTFTNWSFASNWNGTIFTTSGQWLMGQVTYTNGSTTSTETAPLLTADLSGVVAVGASGSSTYSGSNQTVTGSITAATMGGSLPSGMIVRSPVGPNANTFTTTPTISGTVSTPGTWLQTSYGGNNVLVTGSWTINPITLTAMANAAAMTYGGTVPTLSGTFLTSAPNLSASWGTTVTTFSNVGSYAVTPSFSYSNGAVAGDYTITDATANATALTVNRANLTLSGTEVYNGTTTLPGSALTATGVNGQTFSVTGIGTSDLSTANVQSNATLANVTNLSLGSSANGGSSSNYNGLSTTGSSVSVTPAPLTATGTTATGRTYNGTDSIALSGATLSGSTYGAVVSLANDATGTLSNGGNAGTDTVSTAMTLSGNGAGNFALTQPTVGSVTITPASLALSTTGVKVYNGAASLTLFGSDTTLSGAVSGQTASLGTSVTGTLSSANAGSNLGGTLSLTRADLTGSGGFSSSNYTLPTSFTGGTITAAPLTATANSASMTYGGTVPFLSGTVTGFVNGQTLASDSGSWTTAATSSSSPGSYGILLTLGSPYSGDYTITNASGNSTALTIKVATNQIVPVDETVANFQSLPSLPGISSVAPSSNGSPSSSSSSNTSSSSTQTTLAESGNSSVTVIEPVETGGGEILSVEKVTK